MKLREQSDMLQDETRVQAYLRAMQQVITPDTVVLEIQAGVGFFAMMAARMGAKHVYALETSYYVYLAEMMAEDNGLADRITFIHQDSASVRLPELADVLVSDLRRELPFNYNNIPLIMDARERLLKANATLIPMRDALWMAPTYAPEWYQKRITFPWTSNAHGLDLSAAHPFVAGTPVSAPSYFPKGEVMQAEAQAWGVVDYASITDPSYRNSLTWHISDSITIDSFCVWFDAFTAPHIRYSHRPGVIDLLSWHGQLTFPLLQPLTLPTQATLSIDLYAQFQHGDYLWKWETVVKDASGQTLHHLRQNSFASNALEARARMKAAQRKAHTRFNNRLDTEGELLLNTLRGLSLDFSVDYVARTLLEMFPTHFDPASSAWDYVESIKARHLINDNRG